MEFEKLKLESDKNWFQRLYQSQRLRKTILFIILGALAGFIITYFTEGRVLSEINSKDILTNVFTGAFIGFFITNSPCARNKC